MAGGRGRASKWTSWSSALCLLALAGPAAAAPETSAAAAAPSPLPQLDHALATIAADPVQPMASLSVLAIRDGAVVYQQQFGWRHIDADGSNGTNATNATSGSPATPATMYRIASISKMMTTFGLMKLVEDGKLRLDDDVGNYLGYPLRNPHFPDQVITLRMLLSHTASLRDGGGYSWGTDSTLREVLTPGARLYGEGAMWAAQHGPGSYFTYCNLDWGVIGTVMERVTGERFDRLMQRLLLAPLGIRGGYNPAAMAPGDVANIATLYRKRTTDTEVWNPAGPWIAQVDDYAARQPMEPAGIAHYVIGSNGTLFSPTGGLRISAADMGKVMLMLLDNGSYAGKRILRPETIALMFARQWQAAEPAGADGKAPNGDTDRGFYRSWGLGNQQFEADLSVRGAQGSNNNGLVEGADFSAAGHLGDAYGLLSAFVVDFRHKNGMISLIGGTGTDPQLAPGRYSALSRYEENVLTTLYRGAIAPAP